MGLRLQSSLCALNHVQLLITLSLFAQSVGCPKRLIKTEPDQLSVKGLLHFENAHAYAYACIFFYLMTEAESS